MNVKAFWNAVISQDRETLASYFCEGATIRWHCTNEQFTVSEYIEANCDYPGNWTCEIERIEETDHGIVLVGRVLSSDKQSSFHVVSFIKLSNDLISEIDEYWGEDGEASSWRKTLRIGKQIYK